MNIQGQNNRIIFAFPDREICCSDTADEKIGKMLERSDFPLSGMTTVY